MEETEILKEEMEKMREDHEIELRLARGGVRNMKAAMAIFEKDSLQRNENGGFSDLDGAISSFKNENPWLFEKPATLSTGMVHGRGGGKVSDSMTDEEYYLALRERRGRG